MVDILFDEYEKKLLEQITAFNITQQGREVFSYNAFTSHPEGILELAVEKEVRVAKALYFILNTDSSRDTGHRLKALERLTGDVFSVKSGLRNNAARVLVEIMKALLYESRHENLTSALELLRDFREVFSGKSGIVRRQLKIYQLLEIPEDRSQLAFDDTVYNASKLNKKNHTHLILDAWIKGVSRLQIIYNNYLKPETVREIISAAAILGVKVDIGVEFPVYFYGKFIRLVWTPTGFQTPASYLRFLASENVRHIFEQGRVASAFHQERIFSLLEHFNLHARAEIIRKYDVSLAELKVNEYKNFLAGQDACELNLSEYIYTEIMLQNVGFNSAESADSRDFLVKIRHELIPEVILFNYINPLIREVELEYGASIASGCVSDNVKGLVKLLNNTGCAYNLTLLTGNVHPWEVPELLYKSKGCITAVEIFNLRDYTLAQQGERQYGHAQINSFRKALNDDNVIKLKKKLTLFISTVSSLDSVHKEKMIENLQKVRKNIVKLLMRYEGKHIEAAIGSGSAGRASVFYGMGLVVEQSLPRAARKVLRYAGKEEHFALPLGCQVYRQVKYRSGGRGVMTLWQRLLAWRNRDRLWLRQKVKEVDDSLEGNIYTLSGRFGERPRRSKLGHWSYLYHYSSTGIKNVIKVLIGFIPAFLTFYLTSDWWVLKYGGGIIWFAITGGRNLLQALLSSGAFNSSTLFEWKSFVDKKRIAESLMFTGLSVPLLEYLTKTVLLNRFMGVDAGSDPFTVYAVMSGINGVYIAGHNLYRGFPLLAVVGNLFRTILAIPVSLALNFVIGKSLLLAGVAGVGLVLTSWSAVISKLASDIVACLIEGIADRRRYFVLAQRVMRELEGRFFSLCERIELLLPRKSVLDVFSSSTLLEEISAPLDQKLDREVILWGLDLLYFWSYKPRSEEVIRLYLQRLGKSEKIIWLEALNILKERELAEKVIAELAPLKEPGVKLFYERNHLAFLADMESILQKLT